ncbi:MAG: hypothetical protein ACRDT5_23760, partial [Mycobacterium sp.]
MNVNADHRGTVGRKLPALVAAILLTCGLASAGPAAANTDRCAPPGMESATALPPKLATAK